jgi:hypothetical protein
MTRISKMLYTVRYDTSRQRDRCSREFAIAFNATTGVIVPRSQREFGLKLKLKTKFPLASETKFPLALRDNDAFPRI